MICTLHSTMVQSVLSTEYTVTLFFSIYWSGVRITNYGTPHQLTDIVIFQPRDSYVCVMLAGLEKASYLLETQSWECHA